MAASIHPSACPMLTFLPLLFCLLGGISAALDRAFDVHATLSCPRAKWIVGVTHSQLHFPFSEDSFVCSEIHLLDKSGNIKALTTVSLFEDLDPECPTRHEVPVYGNEVHDLHAVAVRIYEEGVCIQEHYFVAPSVEPNAGMVVDMESSDVGIFQLGNLSPSDYFLWAELWSFGLEHGFKLSALNTAGLETTVTCKNGLGLSSAGAIAVLCRYLFDVRVLLVTSGLSDAEPSHRFYERKGDQLVLLKVEETAESLVLYRKALLARCGTDGTRVQRVVILKPDGTAMVDSNTTLNVNDCQ